MQGKREEGEGFRPHLTLSCRSNLHSLAKRRRRVFFSGAHSCTYIRKICSIITVRTYVKACATELTIKTFMDFHAINGYLMASFLCPAMLNAEVSSH